MFVKVTNGQIDQYPYTVGDLRRENPGISFPKKIPDQVMADYGMFPVKMTEAPKIDHRYQTLSNDVQLVGDQWTQVWSVSNLPEDVASSKTRSYRDKLLSDTDWMPIRAQETGTPIKPQWVSYRQALRDITSQGGFPYQVEWPVKPEVPSNA